jgi:hypothetical protein
VRRALHRLALALGCTVAELGERMSSTELNDWLAYGAVEPFGEEQADRRAALVCAALVAVNTPKGKTPKPDAAGFLAMLRPTEKPKQTPEQLKAAFAARARADAKRTRNPRAKAAPKDGDGGDPE